MGAEFKCRERGRFEFRLLQQKKDILHISCSIDVNVNGQLLSTTTMEKVCSIKNHIETVVFICFINIPMILNPGCIQVRFASLLTVGALLGTGSQQKLSHGHVIGHDGDIEGQEAFAVRRVEIQLLQTVLREQELYQVQLLMFHCLKQSLVTLKLGNKRKYTPTSDNKSFRFICIHFCSRA